MTLEAEVVSPISVEAEVKSYSIVGDDIYFGQKNISELPQWLIDVVQNAINNNNTSDMPTLIMTIVEELLATPQIWLNGYVNNIVDGKLAVPQSWLYDYIVAQVASGKLTAPQWLDEYVVSIINATINASTPWLNDMINGKIATSANYVPDWLTGYIDSAIGTNSGMISLFDIVTSLSMLADGHTYDLSLIQEGSTKNLVDIDALKLSNTELNAAIINLRSVSVSATDASTTATQIVAAYFNNLTASAWFASQIAAHVSAYSAIASNVSILQATLNGTTAKISAIDDVFVGQFKEWDGYSTPTIGMMRQSGGIWYMYLGGTLGELSNGWVRTDGSAMAAVDQLAYTTGVALANLESQLDGSISTWFYDYSPEYVSTDTTPELLSTSTSTLTQLITGALVFETVYNQMYKYIGAYVADYNLTTEVFTNTALWTAVYKMVLPEAAWLAVDAGASPIRHSLSVNSGTELVTNALVYHVQTDQIYKFLPLITENNVNLTLETWTNTVRWAAQAHTKLTTERNNHTGDLFYNNVTGYAYRYLFSNIDDNPDQGLIYSWVKITDTDITLALQNASKAQDTADGKRTVYYSNLPGGPVAQVVNGTTIPIAIGDLWVNSVSRVTLVCIQVTPSILWGDITNTSAEHATALLVDLEEARDGIVSTFYATSTSINADTAVVVLDTMYSVRIIGTSVLADWQARFLNPDGTALTAVPIVGQTLKCFSAGTLVGTGRVTASTYGDYLVDTDSWTGTEYIVSRYEDTLGRSTGVLAWRPNTGEVAKGLSSSYRAQILANTAQGTADGKATVYYNTLVEIDVITATWTAQQKLDNIGDSWVNTTVGANLVMKTWSGTGWANISNTRAEEAYTQSIRTGILYNAVLASPPTAAGIGDIWVVTDQWYTTASGSTISGTQYTVSAEVSTGKQYVVEALGTTTLAQWQAFFSVLTIPVVGQSILCIANGTIVGGATVKIDYGKAVKRWNGSAWVILANGSTQAAAIVWAGYSSKLLTAPDGGITGWEFGNGSGAASQFKIHADNFQIVTSGQSGMPQNPFTVNGATGSINFNGNVSITGITTPLGTSLGVYRGAFTAPPAANNGDTYLNTGTGIIMIYANSVWTSTQGEAGVSGDNAAILSINNSGVTFVKDAVGAITPASVSLTTTLTNMTSATYLWYKNNVTTGVLTSTYSIPSTDFSSLNTNTYKCIATGTVNGVAGVVLNDSIVVPRLDSGTNAPSVALSNSDISFPALVTGYTGITFTSGVCVVSAYIGSTLLTYGTTGANTFSIGTLVNSGVTVTNTSATINAPTAMSTDTATCTIPVTTRNSAGVAQAVINVVITYSLSRAGVAGTVGLSTYTATVYKQATTDPGSPVATASTYNFSTGLLVSPTGWLIVQPTTTTTPTWACEYTFSGLPSTTVTGVGSYGPTRIDAVAGGNGVSTTVVEVYSNTLSTPPTSGTYNFSTNTVSTLLAGWSMTMPASSTSATYMSTSTFSATYPATVSASDGVWSTPVVVARNGATGQGQVKGICFLRSATAPTTPAGGSYSSTTATGWSDGIPTGTLPLYMTTRIFTNDGLSPQQSVWSTPQLTSSLGQGINVQFSIDGTTLWHDTPATADQYMRTGTSTDGNSTWVYPSGATKIKGETGISGTDVNIIFKATSSNTVAPTITGTGVLPTGWSDGIDQTNSTTSSTNPYLWYSKGMGVSGVWSWGAAKLNTATNIAELKLYKLNDTAISTAGSYNFGTATLSAYEAGWTTSVPSLDNNGDIIYVTTAIVKGAKDSVVVPVWSAPVTYAQRVDGATGSIGTSTYTATVYLQQSAVPSSPSGGSYNFGTNTLIAPTGWAIIQPATTTTPTYACEYTFTTATIGVIVSGPVAPATWGPVRIDAVSGTSGTSVNMVEVYGTTTSLPTFTGYNFSTNALVGTDAAWSMSQSTSTTTPTYMSRRRFSTTSINTSATDGSWSTPVIVAKNGIDGATATVYNIDCSSYVISKNAIDAATDGAYTNITATGKRTIGGITTTYGYITITSNLNTEATLATANSITTAIASTADTSSYTIKMYDVAAKTNLLDTQVIPVIFKGATGLSAVSSTLSNSSHTVPTASDGSSGVFTGCSTTMNVYIGGVDDSTNWTYTTVASSGISAFTGTGTRTVTVTGMTTASTTATITITASKTGYANQVQVFSLAKAKAGSGAYELTFVDTGYVAGITNSVYKTGVTAGWNAQAYSNEGYTSGAIVSFKAAQTTAYVMVGLTSDPDPAVDSSSYTNIDYALYINPLGVLKIYENGVNIAITASTYTTSSVLSIVYDGVDIKYYNDSTLIRTVARPIGLKLYMDSSFNTVGATINSLTFNSYATVGTNGTNGTAGSRGSGMYRASSASWFDSTAAAACPNGIAVSGDTVTLYTTGSSVTKQYNGTSWVTPAFVVDGNMVATGSITTAHIAAGSITADKITVGMGGANLLKNSMPQIGGETSGWKILYASTAAYPVISAGVSPYIPTGGAGVMSTVTGICTVGTYFRMVPTAAIPVTPGERYEYSGLLSAYNLSGSLQVSCYAANGTLVGYVYAVTGVTTRHSGDIATWNRYGGFITIPATTAYVYPTVVGIVTSGSVSTQGITASMLYFGKALVNQTILSPWSGESGDGLIVSNDFSGIGGAGFRLKSNAAGTSADPTIYGAYIKGGTIEGNQIVSQDLIKMHGTRLTSISAGMIGSQTIITYTFTLATTRTVLINIDSHYVVTAGALAAGYDTMRADLYVDGAIVYSSPDNTVPMTHTYIATLSAGSHTTYWKLTEVASYGPEVSLEYDFRSIVVTEVRS